jgi:hypothetical protein
MKNRLWSVAGVLLTTAAIIASLPAVAADPPAASPDAKAIDAGLPATEQLLFLMDSDKSGKVSKEEYMQFMDKEFDALDRNKDGVLDLAELKRLVPRMRHPSTGPGR